MKPILTLIAIVGLLHMSISQEINITFPSDNFTIEGTLSIPSGAGPFPTIILVHGSGPNDRDQTLNLTGSNAVCLYPNLVNSTIANFKDLAQNLSANGYAVLRYDKRTYTYGAQIDQKSITLNDFITDIHSAVDFVKSHPKVDSNCISLLGHSQGSNLIPIVALNRNDIQSLISLGGSSSRIDSLLAMQIRNIYYTCNQDTLTGDQNYTQIINAFQLIANNSWNPNTPLLGGYPAFWKSWLQVSEMAISNYQSVTIPKLFIHGMDDLNVPTSDAQKLENALIGTHTDVIYLSGINHYMTSSTSPTVDTSVINSILTWKSQNTCTTTGIESSTLGSRKVIWWQNESIITIQSPKPLAPYTLSIFDISGRKMIEKNGTPMNNILIPKKEFVPGIYLVTVKSLNIQIHEKIMIW